MVFRFMDWSLRTKIAALLVTASLLPMLVAGLIDLRGARAQLLANTENLLQARGDQLVRELDDFNRGYSRASNRTASLPDVRAVCREFASQAQPNDALKAEALGIFAVYSKSDSGIRGVALLDRSGHVVLASEPAMIGADLSYQPHVQSALQGKKVISDVFIGIPLIGETPTIAYLTPILSDAGQADCVIALWVRAQTLWDVFKASNALAGKGSFAVLFDRAGVRIAHTYSDDIVFHPGGILDAATKAQMIAQHRFGARTQALLDDVRDFPEQFDRARSEAPDSSVFRGFAPVNQTWNYGVARRFSTVPWTVFYMIPEAGLNAQLSALTREKALLMGAGILLAGLLGLLFARSILRSIQALSAATATLAAGDLGARVQYDSHDELGRLGDSFNAMAARIESQSAQLLRARDELENRVQERTAELQQAMRDLESEIAVRKQTEEAIRESKQLLQAVIDNTTAVIYVKDLAGRYLLVNRRFSELFHLDYSQVLGRTDYDLFPQEAADQFRTIDIRVSQEAEALIEEEFVPQDDGMHTYVSVKCPLRDARGQVTGIFGISTDITERKHAELKLRASEARTRLIVETALDAVVMMDRDGLITGWNPQAEAIFGWPVSAAIGRSLADTIIPQHLREAHRAGLARYLAGGEAVVLNRRLEITALHRDGREFPVELAIASLELDGTVGFSAFVRDITERKHAETKLQEQLQRLNLLDQITRAIGERQDLQSIYQVAIRSVEERLPVDFSCICRYDNADEMLTVIRVGVADPTLSMALALGENTQVPIDQNGLARCVRGELVYEPDVAIVSFPFPQRLARGGLGSLVIAPLQSESRVFGILVAARREKNAFSSGECEFLRQLSAHIALAAQQAQLHAALQQAYDDLRQTQQAVMQQERLRALGQMASGIAHDINNAISPVALYSESLLESEPGLSVRARGYLQTIARAIDDVAATVARMREFYRQREPQLTLLPMRLASLVEQVLDLTRARWSDMPQQRGTYIHLETEFADALPDVLGIESEVREALINLIFNAVDAMPEGGVLTLRTRLQHRDANNHDNSSHDSSQTAVLPDQVCIEVIDSGVGMNEDTRRRCLEPFFTTKGERGTGLGLAMVYGVAQRHGAAIEIDSAPGRGTTVRLSFPAAIVAAALPAQVPEQSLPSRMRILLVDDDPLLLKSLRDILEADGHLIVSANGGQAGIEAFRTTHGTAAAFHAVITDLGMPYIDGRKVASGIKEIAANTPVILLTGWGQRLMADGERPAHVDYVLSKPPKLRELRKALVFCQAQFRDSDVN
jgi:PAS domain S-box-containing protein